MTVYVTQQDLVDRFSSQELAQLTDPAAGTTINATTVARAIADASAEIDTRLAAYYVLPLAQVPAVLTRVAADLARYFLWDNRATDQIRNRYKDAVELLNRIGKGDVQLPGAEQLTLGTSAMAVTARAPASQWGGALDAFAPGQS